MSLLDALPLDAHRMNVWFAERTDGNKGCGTQTDPYHSEAFDDVMENLPATPPVHIHLGPGEFQTLGYHDGMGAGQGWQPHPGMKITGSVSASKGQI